MRNLLIACLAAMLGLDALAEEKPATPVSTSIDMENNTENSYGMFKAAIRLGREERPGLSVGVRGFHNQTSEGQQYTAHLDVGAAVPVVPEHITLVPGVAYMVGDKSQRGLGPTLGVHAKYGRLFASAFLERNFALKGEDSFLRLYPLWVEYRVYKRLSAVAVLEALRTHGKTETEKGVGVSIRHFHGSWYAYWMTGVQEEESTPHHVASSRYNTVRIGRSFEFGGRSEE